MARRGLRTRNKNARGKDGRSTGEKTRESWKGREKAERRYRKSREHTDRDTWQEKVTERLLSVIICQ